MTTVAVVLLLLLGPTTDLVCRAVCGFNVAATSHCHHPDADVKVVTGGAGECHSPILVLDLPPAPTRRSSDLGDTGLALPPASPSVSGRPDSRELDSNASPWRLLDRRPLTTTLRI